MKTWVAILIGVSVLAGVFIIVKVFGPSQKTDSKYFDLLMAEKDKAIEREKEYRKETAQFYATIIEESKRKDSILAEKSKVNTIRYEKVPVNVRNYNNEELRLAVTTFED